MLANCLICPTRCPKLELADAVAGLNMGSKLKRLSRIIGHGILRRFRAHEMFLPDLTEDDLKIIAAVKGYTITSPERIYGLINAVRDVAQNQIPGHIVECGGWKGGSIMAVA